MAKIHLIFIALLGLLSCGKSATERMPMENGAESTVVANAVAKAATAKKIAEPEVPRKSNDEVEKPGTINLDLNLPAERQTIIDQTFEFSDEEILPDFFKQQSKEKTTVLSAKLLKDPSLPDFIDSLQGAEVSVEIKLN